MAAAVADFAPASASEGKIKKDGREGLTLALAPTVDILSELSGRRRDGQTLVGFAAEHGPAGLAGAEGKLTGKHLDALVVNDISRGDIGFDVDDNEVTILTAAGGGEVERVHVARAPKEQRRGVDPGGRRAAPGQRRIRLAASATLGKISRWTACTTCTGAGFRCSITATTRPRSCR